LNYANSCRIIPHIFSNCLFSFAFLLFPSLTCLSFFSSSRFLSFYPYLRLFRLSLFISLIFVHFAYLCSFRLSSFISPELYSGIGSSEPPYIDQAWSISRLLPFFFPFARMTFGYTTTAAKRHFFSPYRKKNRNSLANVRFFSYLCSPKLKYIRA